MPLWKLVQVSVLLVGPDVMHVIVSRSNCRSLGLACGPWMSFGNIACNQAQAAAFALVAEDTPGFESMFKEAAAVNIQSVYFVVALVVQDLLLCRSRRPNVTYPCRRCTLV